MGKSSDYSRTVIVRAFEEYAWVRDALFGLAVNLATLLLGVYEHLVSPSDWTNWRLLVLVIVAPYAIAIFAHVSWKIATSIVHLHSELQDQIAQLQDQIAHLKTRLASQVIVTELKYGEPRIEAEFVDERTLGDKSSSLRLTNRGAETAYMVRMLPIKLKERTLVFPHISEFLDSSLSARFAPFVGEQWGDDSHSDFIHALSEEWISYGESDRREIVVPARIDYENSEGTRFEANFEIFYHAGYAGYNPHNVTLVECRNFTFRKIPLGITPQ